MLAFSMLASCATRQPPSVQGQLLTTDQIDSLQKDKSMNGKLIEVEGYPSICSKQTGFTAAAPIRITLRKKNSMEVYSESNCGGKKLIDIRLPFEGDKRTTVFGDEGRNYVILDKSAHKLTFIADDYQELPEGKFKISGTLIYDGDNYYLDNVTIHK